MRLATWEEAWTARERARTARERTRTTREEAWTDRERTRTAREEDLITNLYNLGDFDLTLACSDVALVIKKVIS